MRPLSVVAAIGILILGAVSALKLPNGLQPCKPDDEPCLKDRTLQTLHALKNGVKSHGMLPIDPLHIQTMDIAGSGGSVDLNQHFDDTMMSGVTDIVINSLKTNLNGDNCKIVITSYNPRLELIGRHRLTGKLLLFQLNGSGRSNITIDGTDAESTILCKKVTRNGKVYLDIINYTFKMSMKRLYFDFENVIDGNPELSTEVNKVANENDQEIFKEVQPEYERTFSEIFKQVVKQFFAKIPMEEAFDMA